jgi:hypothetical protein
MHQSNTPLVTQLLLKSNAVDEYAHIRPMIHRLQTAYLVVSTQLLLLPQKAH